VAAEFIDTNVLVYAYAPDNPRKQVIAREIVERLGTADLVLSTQVLAEFAATLLKKLAEPPEAVIERLDALNLFRLIAPDARMVRRAVEAHAQYTLHFYDGMIIAAAERAGCSRIWSEDLNPGQTYFGVLIANPFN
jgi:predicted nucleic acid-binding protein